MEESDGELGLPHNIVSSEFLTMEGSKFSSSRGVAIYINDFLSRYDPDPLRYFLTIAGPETQDTDFTWTEFVRRNNDELVAAWGNLVNRTLTSAYRNFGAVPQPGTLTQEDKALIKKIENGFESVGALLEETRFKEALSEVMRLARGINLYLSEQEPWQLIKDDRERAGTVLYVALRSIDNIKIMMTPFLPFTSQRLHEMLGYEGYIAGPLEFREYSEDDGGTHRVLTGDYTNWVGRWQPSVLPVGQRLNEPKPLYKKLDSRVVGQEMERLEARMNEEN